MPAIMIGLSLANAGQGGGGGLITLPYDPVLVIIGDSNARGSAAAADQTAYVASYVADPKIFVLNASNAFVQYVPGTLAGMNGLANHANVGSEIGFIRRFKARYSNNLYIMKLAYAGATQTRGDKSGDITASISGNLMTVTAGTVAAQNLIVGAGVPTGAIVNSLSGGNVWFMSKIGQTAALSATVASESMDVRNSTITTTGFSPDENTTWSGLAGSITNGYRNKSVVGLATLTTKKIVAVMHMLGTNDKALSSGAYTRYTNDAQTLIAAMKSNWSSSLPGTQPIVLARVRGADTGSLAVRGYQQDIVTADSQCQLMDMDGYTTHDGTHFQISQLDLIGDALFDRAVF